MNGATDRPRILVTGGAGFIGSHLCELLLASGARVVAVDDLSTGRRSNLDAAFGRYPGQLELVESTVAAALPSLAGTRFDAIYHLAAAVGVRLILDDPAGTAAANVVETDALLRHAAAHRTPFLLASTSEVYGKGTQVPFREDGDLAFGPPTASRWSYGLSKAVDEQMVLGHAARGGLPVVVVRLFNTVGPRQVGRYGMVLPRFVAAALAGQPLEVHGSGAQVRCFCHVREVVPAMVALLGDPRCHGRVYNVGSDRPVSIANLAREVVRVTGSASPIVNVPYATAFGTGFEDLEVRIPDLRRVREAIGFAPALGIERIIADVAEDLGARRASVREGAA